MRLILLHRKIENPTRTSVRTLVIGTVTILFSVHLQQSRNFDLIVWSIVEYRNCFVLSAGEIFRLCRSGKSTYVRDGFVHCSVCMDSTNTTVFGPQTARKGLAPILWWDVLSCRVLIKCFPFRRPQLKRISFSKERNWRNCQSLKQQMTRRILKWRGVILVRNDRFIVVSNFHNEYRFPISKSPGEKCAVHRMHQFRLESTARLFDSDGIRNGNICQHKSKHAGPQFINHHHLHCDIRQFDFHEFGGSSPTTNILHLLIVRNHNRIGNLCRLSTLSQRWQKIRLGADCIAVRCTVC